MKIRLSLILLVLLAAFGCGTSNPLSPSPSSLAVRTYSGTASVGDFLSISLDPVAQTVTYNNYSNGDSGTIPYTVNSDGTYTFNDPTGNLVAGFEVPNYGLLIQANKAGPNHATPALITAIQKASISLSSIGGNQYNYIQFRTTAGGMEIGSVSIDTVGNATVSNYWPYGALGTGGPATPFQPAEVMPASGLQPDASGTFMKLVVDGETSYVFGTANGVFAVDTQNGAILAFQKASTKNFDPSFAGTYKAIYYEKIGANTGNGNIETGTPQLGQAILTIDASAGLTITDTQGNTLLSKVSLTPVADASYLYNASVPYNPSNPTGLADPCYGLFTYRLSNGDGPQQDVFATFVNGAILFSSFTPNSRTGSGYDYFYGVGLIQ